MKKSIYIVEDDREINEGLKMAFEESGFGVKSFLNGNTFLEDLPSKESSCFLVDWNLPDTNGIELIKHIRSRDPLAPVFLMTASREEEIAMHSLASGADHYIRKPFNLNELLLRFEIAHNKLNQLEDNYIQRGIKLLPEASTFIKDGKTYKLTAREFAIFKMLYDRKEPLTREELIKELSQSDRNFPISERNCDVHIHALRKKIKPSGLEIKTIWGVGYRLMSEDQSA